MKRFNLRSLLVLAFLVFPASHLTGQSTAELRERREQERLAQRQIEEQLYRVQEAHQRTSQEAHESQREAERAYLMAIEEAQQAHQHTTQEREQALRMALERAQQARLRGAQERGRALVLAQEGVRDRMKSLQQVMVQVRSRARLGVSLDVRQGRDLDEQGAIVKSVLEDSPAEGAGIHVGDIITHLDGHSLLDPIPNEEDEDFDDYESLPVQRLMALAQELEDGEPVEVRYLRDGASASVSMTPSERTANWFSSDPEGSRRGVFLYGPEGRSTIRLHLDDRDELREELLPRLEEMKERFKDLTIEFDDLDLEEMDFGGGRAWTFRSNPDVRFFSPEGRFTPGEGNARFHIYRGDGDSDWSVVTLARGYGLDLRDLNPDLGSYFSADKGVLVMSIDQDSSLPLQAGDVILRVGDRTVEDTNDFYRIMRSYEEGEGVTITVMRHGQETRVEGEAR